jgi:hypothetical protein
VSNERALSLPIVVIAAVLGFSALPACAQQPELPPPTAKPALPDLDVTYIERTPKYPPQGAFKYTEDGECIRAKEDPPVKHWPDPGEEVTFIAYVVNKGGASSPEADYMWQLDGGAGKLEEAGTKIKALEPGQETTVGCKWKWSQEPHRIAFFADPGNKVYEICERNNFREDQTNAKAIMIRVHPTIAKGFDEHFNAIGSFSFEDWIQEHVRMLNEELAAAVWPTTPKGCLERMRIDPFKVAGTEEMNTVSAMLAPYYADGGWQFHDSPAWTVFALSCNFTSVRDDGLIHELTHQLGVVDNYSVETGAAWRDENDPEAPVMQIYFRSRKSAGLMGTESDVDDELKPQTAQWIRAEPDTHVVQGMGVGRSGFSEWEAAGLNHLLEFRRGHFGLYLSDLAKNNYVRVLDRSGKPVAGATVSTYPAQIANRQPMRTPRFMGKTDKDGLVNLGPRPWDKISCIAINALMFVRIDHPSLAAPENHWLELAEFNIGCWRDGGEKTVLVVNTGIGGVGAPKPPTAVRVEPIGDPKGATLVWEPSTTKEVASYRIYKPSPYQLPAVETPMPSRERPYFLLVKEVAATQHSFKLEGPEAGGCAFAVTAVDSKGRESSDGVSPIPLQIMPREGGGTVQMLLPPGGEKMCGRSAKLVTAKGKCNFNLTRFLSSGDTPTATVKDECVLRFGIRTKSTEPALIAFREKDLGMLAIRVTGTGGLAEGQKEVGTIGKVSDGALHEIKLNLKAILDKTSGKTGPYTIGDILFGNFGGDANPAEYELRDVALRRK